MALSQSLPDVYVPTFEMTVGNRKLETSLAKSIMELTVTEHLTGPNSFSFRLNDPELALIDERRGPFTEGTRVEIKMGFVGKTRKMIIGEISALAADLPSSGPAAVHVQGFDFFHVTKSGHGLPPIWWRDVLIAGFSTVRSSHGSPRKCSCKHDVRTNHCAWAENSKQRHQSGFSSKAGETERILRSGRFWFHLLWKRTPATSRETIWLEWGRISWIFPRGLARLALVNEVVVRSWDPIQKQRISVSVKRANEKPSLLSETGLKQISKGSGGRSQRVIDVPVANLLEAEALADSVLSNQQVTAISGSGTCLGDPTMRVGGKLELRGIGRFSGTYYISTVTHSISGSAVPDIV